ncbi:hypothetical protein ES703_00869 [subsurface metagenome]|nr:hypothetical protein [bacterium]
MAEVSFPSATEEQINEGKSLAWLSYLGILFLIPLLAHKDNPFSKYHARQGMVLFFVEVALGIVWGILYAIALAIAFGVGGVGFCLVLVWIIMALAYLFVGILALIGLIQALSGKFWKMPILGDLAEKWFKGMV